MPKKRRRGYSTSTHIFQHLLLYYVLVRGICEAGNFLARLKALSEGAAAAVFRRRCRCRLPLAAASRRHRHLARPYLSPNFCGLLFITAEFLRILPVFFPSSFLQAMQSGGEGGLEPSIFCAIQSTNFYTLTTAQPISLA